MEKYDCVRELNYDQIITQSINYCNKIGLIKPKETENNHHYYDEKTLAKLQYITILRYMHFSSQEIKEILKDNNFNLKESLKIQAELLKEEANKINEIADSLIALSNQVDQSTGINYDLMEKTLDYGHESCLQKRRSWQIKYIAKMQINDFNKNINKWQYYQSIMK